jgi:starch synthase
VTRIVEQKFRLLFERGTAGRAAIEEIIALLEARDGLYMIQGTGMPEYESILAQLFRKSRRLLFLKGYSEELANALFRTGDLFLMPSSFEPCGISQMVAMRERQPCVVHAVGGLKDTVIEGVNGFTFSGATPTAQSDGFAAAVGRALDLHANAPDRWQRMRAAAGEARFTWEKAAREYDERVYHREGKVV